MITKIEAKRKAAYILHHITLFFSRGLFCKYINIHGVAHMTTQTTALIAHCFTSVGQSGYL